MRRTASIGLVATLGAASVALASSGTTTKPRTPSLAQAAARTAQVRRQRYSLEITIVQDKTTHIVRASSAVAPGTVSVQLELDAVTLPTGDIIPSSSTAGLIEGPFLYERAPDGLTIGGANWVRLSIARIGSTSLALRGMHGMTAMPLLHVLGEAHAYPMTRNASIFRGTVAYDDPIVVTALQPLTVGLQFRDLRVAAWIGPGGLVRHVRLTGHTADRTTTLLVDAHLFGFGRPVQITPPAEGAFLDESLLRLRN
ncbi:MAG TPA: hypothetical protein VFM96_06060 [Gaiellaceae bacterium]|nr:hypothetical protein [Gaiellaceae bacterium]